MSELKSWQRFSSYKQLATGKSQQYSYINRTAWHKAGGKRHNKLQLDFVERVKLILTPIPSWAAMPEKTRQALFKKRVRKLEKEFRKTRNSLGLNVMTQNAMAKLDCRARPKIQSSHALDSAKKQAKMPLCHSSSLAGALNFKESRNTFLGAYKESSARYLTGEYNVEFPMDAIRPPILQVC